MKHQKPKKSSKKSIRLVLRDRFTLIYAVFGLLFIGMIVRALCIHLAPQSAQALAELASRQYQKQLQLYPYRGTIYDRRQNGLAISTKKGSFFVNPRVFSPTPSQIKKIAAILRTKEQKIIDIANKKSYFSWLSRRVSEKVERQLLALNINGLHIVAEPTRFYPYGEALSQILGFSGVDNKGIMGLEKYYEKYLQGKENKFNLTRDAHGQFIFRNVQQASPELPGHNIHLTIDLAIQEITEAALAKGVHSAQAKSGAVIVQDPHTGKILALASYPTFSPNHPSTITSTNTRTIPLVDLFEPGSVVKPIVIAEALEQGKIQPNELIDCEDTGVYQGVGWQIRDTHHHGHLSVSDILSLSSNIGAYKVATRLGKQGLYNTFKKFGIGTQDMRLNFPGTTNGMIPDPKQWSELRFANIAFGQGLLASGLEIASAYSAIANGGNLMKPYMVQFIKSPTGEVVLEKTATTVRKLFSPKTAKFIKKALYNTVENGTGTLAKLDHFTAAGKTGTSEKIDPKTKAYSKDLRSASFVGFTPVWDSHLTIYVQIDEPGKTPYYGGVWAAPVFQEIAEKTLKYLNVAPDRKQLESPGLAKGVFDIAKPIAQGKSQGAANIPKPVKLASNKELFGGKIKDDELKRPRE